jgi:hypothetical protein
MMRSAKLALAAIVAIGATAACTRTDNRAADTGAPGASPTPTAEAYGMGGDGPSAGQIASSPASYAGQRVTVKSDVERVMPNGFFILDDNDLLVLSPSASPMEKQEVTVRGTVHTYSAPELQQKFAWFRSDKDRDVEYENRAVIVADSITAADGREILGESALPAGSGEPDTTAGGSGGRR